MGVKLDRFDEAETRLERLYRYYTRRDLSSIHGSSGSILRPAFGPPQCSDEVYGDETEVCGTGIGSRREAQLSEDTFSGKPRGEVQGCLPECETAAVRHKRLCPETSGRSLQVGRCEVNIGKPGDFQRRVDRLQLLSELWRRRLIMAVGCRLGARRVWFCGGYGCSGSLLVLEFGDTLFQAIAMRDKSFSITSRVAGSATCAAAQIGINNSSPAGSLRFMNPLFQYI